MSTNTQHVEKYTLPIAATLRVQKIWRVSMNQDSDPEFSFVRENQVSIHTHDAFEVRSEFFSLQTPDQALRFFERYGPFQISPASPTGTKADDDARVDSIKWSAIQQAQEHLAEALQADGIPIERRWVYEFVFGQSIALEWSFRSAWPEESRGTNEWAVASGIDDAAFAVCHDVVDALRVSIFLSRKSGFRWSRCARKACNALFEQTTQRNKLYCSPGCAHLQAANDYNARKKSKSRNGKARKINPKPTKRR